MWFGNLGPRQARHGSQKYLIVIQKSEIDMQLYHPQHPLVMDDFAISALPTSPAHGSTDPFETLSTLMMVVWHERPRGS
jgi:hypothetical protein